MWSKIVYYLLLFCIWNLLETRIKKYLINQCQYLPWQISVGVNYSEYIFKKRPYLENHLQACSVFVLHQLCIYAYVWADEWVEANCWGECSMDISSQEDQTQGKILIILLPWNFEWVSDQCAKFQNHTQELMCWRIFIFRRIIFTAGTEEEALMRASMHVFGEYSWVFSFCRGRIIVDLQGLKTMSRHTSGTHSQSVTQWNTINSCLMLPHGHCPPCSEGWGKAGICETRRHIFTCNPNDSCQFLLLSSFLLTHFLFPALSLHRCVTRLKRVTLTSWWLTSVSPDGPSFCGYLLFWANRWIIQADRLTQRVLSEQCIKYYCVMCSNYSLNTAMMPVRRNETKACVFWLLQSFQLDWVPQLCNFC